MRVLHLINAFNRGGVEKWLLNMLAEIPRDICAIDVCCKGAALGPWAPIAEQHRARIYHCPLRPTQVGYVRGLRRILQENRYDLIHNHLGIYAGIPVWVARRANVPVITTFHAHEFVPAATWLSLPVLLQMLQLYAYFSVGYAMRYSHVLTAVSQGVIEEVIPDKVELRQKSQVLTLGAYIPPQSTEAEKRSLRESLGWSGETPLVSHVGRFYDQKNHFGLLRAFERVRQDIPDAKLLLVGVGPLASGVERYVQEHDLSPSVRMLGAQDNAAALIAKSDVLLFPSFWEGFGIVALEANAAGVPVVGSDVVGLNEAVENGRTALLYDVSDTEAMAAAVVRILTDPVYARQLGEAGRARAERLFSVKASAEKLLQLYKRVLDSPAPADARSSG